MDQMKDWLIGVFDEKTWHMTKDIMLALSGVVFGIIVVIVLVVLGWFIVWKLFLVRFPLIRELVYGNGDDGKKGSRSPPSSNGQTLRRSTRLKTKTSHSD